MRINSSRFVCGIFLCCGASYGEMRVASLNIAKQYGPKVLAEIARQRDLRKADVLLLQEVVDGPGFHMARDVAKELGLNFVFAPAFRLNRHFDEGLAILSKYPLGPGSVVPLSHNELHFHTRIRIALTATIESPSGPVRIVNTHLDNRINSDAKREQLTDMWRATEHYSGPCIVGGDFNTGNFRWISHVVPLPGIQSLRDIANDEMVRHGFSTPLGSGPGTLHLFGLKLDWIYMRGFSANDSGVSPIRFSDHNSVWVVIQAL